MSWFCPSVIFASFIKSVFSLIIITSSCFMFIPVFMFVYVVVSVCHVCPLPVFCFRFYFVVTAPSVFSFFTSCLCDCLPHSTCVQLPLPSLCVYKSLCFPLSLLVRCLNACRNLLSCRYASSPVLLSPASSGLL